MWFMLKIIAFCFAREFFSKRVFLRPGYGDKVLVLKFNKFLDLVLAVKILTRENF
jgi:hypothetical protein